MTIEERATIVLSKNRARKLRAFLNRNEWRESTTLEQHRAVEDVLQQIKEQV